MENNLNNNKLQENNFVNKYLNYFYLFLWGLGIGDWGLGIGDWGLGQSPIPNPQSPIPNPHILTFYLKMK